MFRLVSDSNLVLVDWITSGRHANGENWDFELYKSINNLYLEDDHPLFLDTVLLEKRTIQTIAERMQDYQAIAMLILFGSIFFYLHLLFLMRIWIFATKNVWPIDQGQS
uniref:Urease accessory protein D n=1 Tax=Noccaea caerulescens TaxID=107243 RepID=A0A1J3CIK5_NOCCA